MRNLLVLRDYAVWHYGRAYADIFRVWKNYLWFVLHLFSVKTTLLTLLSPWKRIKEKPVNFFADPGEFFGNLIVDLLMRALGACIRLGLLAFAAITFCLIFFFGLVFFAFWTIAPVLIIQFFITGFVLLF